MDTNRIGPRSDILIELLHPKKTSSSNTPPRLNRRLALDERSHDMFFHSALSSLDCNRKEGLACLPCLATRSIFERGWPTSSVALGQIEVCWGALTRSSPDQLGRRHPSNHWPLCVRCRRGVVRGVARNDTSCSRARRSRRSSHAGGHSAADRSKRTGPDRTEPNHS